MGEYPYNTQLIWIILYILISLRDCQRNHNMVPPPVTDVGPADAVDKADAVQRSWIENVESVNKLDTVMDTYRSYSQAYRSETEKQLVRKVDRRLLPLVVTIYLFNYLDRNSITQARLYGLQKDTHVTGALYQTAISIFSAGYIAMQLPSAMLMTKLRPSLFLVSANVTLPISGKESISLSLIIFSRHVSSHGLS